MAIDEVEKIELHVVSSGKLSQCPHMECGYTCCDFSGGNFIALYPGELATAQRREESTGHLELTPDSAGGHRAICRATDTSTCDEGYKPLDCASYPLFPVVNSEGQVEVSLKGSKCPLQAADLRAHRIWVLERWRQLEQTVHGLRAWLKTVRLVGYERLSSEE